MDGVLYKYNVNWRVDHETDLKQTHVMEMRINANLTFEDHVPWEAHLTIRPIKRREHCCRTSHSLYHQTTWRSAFPTHQLDCQHHKINHSMRKRQIIKHLHATIIIVRTKIKLFMQIVSIYSQCANLSLHFYISTFYGIWYTSKFKDKNSYNYKNVTCKLSGSRNSQELEEVIFA